MTFNEETFGESEEIVSTRTRREPFIAETTVGIVRNLLDSSPAARSGMDSSLLIVLFADEAERFLLMVRRTCAICFFRLATCFDRGSARKKNKHPTSISFFAASPLERLPMAWDSFSRSRSLSRRSSNVWLGSEIFTCDISDGALCF